MKVILLEELKGKGGEGDVVEVSTGYAVNFLLPRKIAIAATAGNLKQLEQRKHNIDKRETTRLDTADKLMATLEGQTIRIGAKVGEEGQLFGSVTPVQIAEAINERFGTEIDRRRIDLRGLVKTVGEHPATIGIYRDIKASIIVEVVDEKELKAAEETSDGKDTAGDSAGDAAAADSAAVDAAVDAAGDTAVEDAAGVTAVDAASDTNVDEPETTAENETEAVPLEKIESSVEEAARTLAQAADDAEGENDNAVAAAAVEVLQNIEGAVDAVVADAIEAEVERREAQAAASEDDEDAASSL
jgi:large subunit ribosomal protein L9